jgi:hypothetical protein
MTQASGWTYDGEWKEDKKHGRGVHTWPDGNKYDGEFKDGKLHGRGVWTWADGDKYDGEFKDSKFNGRGVWTWADGWSYWGEFKEEDKTLVMDAGGVFCHTKSAQTIAATLVRKPANSYRDSAVQKNALDEYLKQESTKQAQSAQVNLYIRDTSFNLCILET